MARQVLDGDVVLLTVLSPPARLDLPIIKELGRGFEHYFCDYPTDLIKSYKRKTCLACKAYMYMCAERLCQTLGCDAIATGEIAGSKASQTVDHLLFLSRLVSLPIYRPLYGMDKRVFPTVAGSKCEIVPRHPSTRGVIDPLPLKEAVATARIYKESDI